MHEAKQVSPFEVMLGIDVFMAWREVQANRMVKKPSTTSRHLTELLSKPLSYGMKARRSAAVQYDRSVRDLSLQTGDLVMEWAPDLVSKEGNKVVPSWLGLYVVERKLSRASYSLRLGIRDASARVHLNRYGSARPPLRCV